MIPLLPQMTSDERLTVVLAASAIAALQAVRADTQPLEGELLAWGKAKGFVVPDPPGDWRETVRDLYDRLHFVEPNMFGTGPAADLAAELIHLIEDRHPGFFVTIPIEG